MIETLTIPQGILNYIQPHNLLIVSLILIGSIMLLLNPRKRKETFDFVFGKTNPAGLSVNYHFTRLCNYNCKFCFHTALESYCAPIPKAKLAIRKLKRAGMDKINFSGGEPFLIKQGRWLGEMVQYCKEQGIRMVSVVSNGSLISKSWFETYGNYLDMLAISCDSFDPKTLEKIGRGIEGTSSVQHLEKLRMIKSWCDDFNVKFKINTVVCSLNYHENLAQEIELLKPVRWKVFQCLLIDGENASENDLRDARNMVVTDEQWEDFCQRHRHVKNFVAESNETMRNSYLILDQKLRFLNNTEGKKIPTRSILDISVEEALQDAGFNEVEFKRRDGDFYRKEGEVKLGPE